MTLCNQVRLVLTFRKNLLPPASGYTILVSDDQYERFALLQCKETKLPGLVRNWPLLASVVVDDMKLIYHRTIFFFDLSEREWKVTFTAQWDGVWNPDRSIDWLVMDSMPRCDVKYTSPPMDVKRGIRVAMLSFCNRCCLINRGRADGWEMWVLHPQQLHSFY